MRLRHKTFAGGIDLPDEKHVTRGSAIAPCPRPDYLLLPLAPLGYAAAGPLVKIGDEVSAGQKVAAIDPSAADAGGVDVYSPLDGVVAEMTTASVAGPAGFVSVPAVKLVKLSMPKAIQPGGQVFQWHSASPSTLRTRLAQSSLTTCRQRGRSMHSWVQAARGRGCGTLIVNAMESQPYVSADHRLLAEHGGDVMRGLAILGLAMEATQLVVAVDSRRTDDYRGLVGPARSYQISRVALNHKYPMGVDPMLVKILTGKEVPPGGSTLDIGVAVTTAAACFAVFRTVACETLVTSRVVTSAGERCGRVGNYHVPFGTPCRFLASSDAGLIAGGPMVGLACPQDAVVTAATDAVLALDVPDTGVPGPCIRCGWCSDHCPARLNVAQINDCFELGQVDRAGKIGVMASMECGVCSYVCPARLPLTHRVKALKAALRAAKGTGS